MWTHLQKVELKNIRLSWPWLQTQNYSTRITHILITGQKDLFTWHYHISGQFLSKGDNRRHWHWLSETEKEWRDRVRETERKRERERSPYTVHMHSHTFLHGQTAVLLFEMRSSLSFSSGGDQRDVRTCTTHTHTQRALALLTLWGSTLPCAPPSNCSQKNLTNRQKCVTPLDQQQDRESQCYLMDLQTSGPPLQPDPHRTGGWRRRWPPRGSHVYPMGSLSNSLQNTSRQKQEMIQILQ